MQVWCAYHAHSLWISTPSTANELQAVDPASKPYGVVKCLCPLSATFLLIFEERYNENDIWKTELHSCLENEVKHQLYTGVHYTAELCGWYRRIQFPPVHHCLCTATQGHISCEHAPPYQPFLTSSTSAYQYIARHKKWLRRIWDHYVILYLCFCASQVYNI